jgi:anti-sigma regulatory factor (Ser/Thr protein kinase)
MLGTDLRAHGIPETSVADAALVLSELMSNAIRYARPLSNAQVLVCWKLTGRSLEIAVTDGGGPTRPYPVRSKPSEAGGRGLTIVGHLSRRWGVRSDEQGTTVWAVLPAGSTGSVPRRARRAPAGARQSAG